MLDKTEEVKEMIDVSFLRSDLKDVYYESYNDRATRLKG